jgi:hypothetical protein
MHVNKMVWVFIAGHAATLPEAFRKYAESMSLII